MIRLTFYCESKEHDTVDLEHGLVLLRQLDDGEAWQFKPDSTIALSRLNPAAFSAFHAGKQYYVDFTEAI